MSNGLNVLFDQASLAQKALDHPETLTEAEKAELRKAFDSMSEEEKSKYRDLLR